MRIVVLIFGLIGVAGSAFIGVRWMKDVEGKEEVINLMYEATRDGPDNDLKRHATEGYRRSQTYHALLGGAALGVVACFVVVLRRGLIAGVLFLIAFAVPVALYRWNSPGLAIFTGALAIAGLLSFFVRPGIPYKPPRRPRGIPEDADLVG